MAMYLVFTLSLLGFAATELTENSIDREQSPYEVLEILARQTMLQQLFVEERIRSDGGSGLKQMRVNIGGTRPYHSASHVARSTAAIHDHANYINTIGLGEFIAVLNGVEFRTRHNDYKLVMPSLSSTEYHATEPIPFPEVPPEVLNIPSVEGQVEEMKQWFKAYMDQDYSVRDYRKYFKPVLCYLEGHWTHPSNTLEESFESERHHIDAKSWLDLQEKVRFTSYSGAKSNLENFAYLPTTIIDVKNGTPVLAQWNYRLLCHPLKDDLPLNRFRVIDDLGARMMYTRTLEEHKNSRAARFQLNPFDEDTWSEGREREGLLDKLMMQVPGVDNYPANISDDAFGLIAHEAKNEGGVLNTGFYHRYYKVNRKGAMGLQLRHRTFSDPNVFMAMTTNPRVPKMGYEYCRGRPRKRICTTEYQRWTYAIPLEIVYMTPLSNWNPHNIEHKDNKNSEYVKKDGRTGAKTLEKAFNGTLSHVFVRTPAEFFQGRGVSRRKGDAADTSNRILGVLDKNGEMKRVGSSGHRIIYNINGLGPFRQRYPIMPVHGQGGAVWKEVEALKDIVLSPMKYQYMFHDPLDIKLLDKGDSPEEKGITGLTLLMVPNASADHFHDIELSGIEVEKLMKGESINTNSEEADGHSHNVKLIYKQNGRGNGIFVADKCDGMNMCEHQKVLQLSVT